MDQAFINSYNKRKQMYELKLKEKKDSSTEEANTIPPAPEGENSGISCMLSSLIKDEWEAIEGYNSAIATLLDLGRDDIVDILTEIANDEHMHIGSLQKAMELVNEQALSAEEGKIEAEEIIEDNNNIIENSNAI